MASDKLDFSQEDKTDPKVLNDIIWKSIKGMNAKVPAAQHGVIPVSVKTSPASEAILMDADGDGK